MLQGHVAKIHRETIPGNWTYRPFGIISCFKTNDFLIEMKIKYKKQDGNMIYSNAYSFFIPNLGMASIPVPRSKGVLLGELFLPFTPIFLPHLSSATAKNQPVEWKNDVPPSPKTCDVFPLQASQVRSSSSPLGRPRQSLSFRGRLMPEASRNPSPPWENCLFCLCFLVIPSKWGASMAIWYKKNGL